MLSRRAAEEPTLYEQLIRRGLPADYARRTADELEDHRADLRADVLDERTVDERIGETRAIAKKIARDYRRRSWFGRWPMLSFVVSTPILLFATWIFLYVVVLPTVMTACESCWGALGFGRPSTLMQSATIETFVFVFLTVVPTTLAYGWSLLALRTTQNRWFAVVVGLPIALLAGSVWTNFDVSDIPGRGHFYLSLPLVTLLHSWVVEIPNPELQSFLFGPRELLQVVAPLAAVGWLLRKETRRRQQSLLAIDAPDNRLATAA